MITKKEIQMMSRKELLDFVEKAKGHSGDDFKEYMDCDFTYSVLVNELKQRGFVNGWYDPEAFREADAGSKPDGKEIIFLNRSEGTERVRTTVDVDKEIWEQWKGLTARVAGKGFFLDLALQRFIKDLKEDRFDFRFKV